LRAGFVFQRSTENGYRKIKVFKAEMRFPPTPPAPSHCQTFMYLIDIKGFLGIEKLTYMADIWNFRWY